MNFLSGGIDESLTRVFEGQATAEELLQLREWLQDAEHYTYFLHFRTAWNVTAGTVISREELEEAVIDFRQYMDAHPLKRRRISYRVAIAAAIVLLLSVSTYFLFQNLNRPLRSPSKQYASQQDPGVLPQHAITLTYADGRVENLGKSGQAIQKITGGVTLCRNNARELEYRKNETPVTGIEYNELTLPAGERFTLILADGTRVWLNSETTLRYPVNFIGKNREVQLQGQAYFEVFPDKAHPFIVRTENMSVEALGTAFDVTAYKEEGGETGMVLVEGKVQVSAGGQQVIADSDEKVVLKHQTGQLTVQRVDARKLTLWKDGILVIRQLNFSRMLHKLEQWYGVTIVNRAQVPEEDLFNGKFMREDVRKALETVRVSTGIDYTVEEDRIVIYSGVNR